MSSVTNVLSLLSLTHSACPIFGFRHGPFSRLLWTRVTQTFGTRS